MKTTACIALALTFVCASASAGPITVDGSGSDWGIDPSTGDFNQSIGTRIFFENLASNGAGGTVGPGFGGQFFDVEAVYALHEGQYLNFAIATGFDPDGVLQGSKLFTPGDIFFDLGSGFNVAVDLQTGQVFTNATHSNPVDFPASAPFTITGGTEVGVASLYVPFNGVPSAFSWSNTTYSSHFLIEGRLDLNLAGAAYSDAGIHWTMSCGNDVGRGYIDAPHMPEPSTICLLGFGLAVTVAGLRRRASLSPGLSGKRG